MEFRYFVAHSLSATQMVFLKILYHLKLVFLYIWTESYQQFVVLFHPVIPPFHEAARQKSGSLTDYVMVHHQIIIYKQNPGVYEKTTPASATTYFHYS